MLARGIRNNNPGNIRHGSKWQGLSAIQRDPSFCTFITMDYGVRALLRLLTTYHHKYHLKTISTIISRWAPSNENNTQAYIRSVSSFMHVDPEEPLEFNRHCYIQLGKAIALHENGKDSTNISDAVWQNGADLANL